MHKAGTSTCEFYTKYNATKTSQKDTKLIHAYIVVVVFS